MGVRVDTFLGCAKLETGGKIIGGLNLVASTLLLIVSSIAFGGFSTLQFESPFSYSRRTTSYRTDNFIAEDLLSNVAAATYSEGILLIIAIFFALIWMSIYGAYLSNRLLDGIMKRSSADVKPFMIISFCSGIFPLSLVLFGAVESLVQLIVGLYCSIIVYSLWRKFVEEEEKSLPTANVPMQAPTVSVNLSRDDVTANQFTNKFSSNNSYHPIPPPGYNI